MILNKYILFVLFLFFGIVIKAQTFSEHNFKINTICNLVKVADTYQDGNKARAYECLVDGTYPTAYRIIVIDFSYEITDTQTYYNNLYNGYSNLGTVSYTYLAGQTAVQVIENTSIYGNPVKQIQTSILYKNKAITLVLVTGSPNYSTLLSTFKSGFSLL